MEVIAFGMYECPKHHQWVLADACCKCAYFDTAECREEELEYKQVANLPYKKKEDKCQK